MKEWERFVLLALVVWLFLGAVINHSHRQRIEELERRVGVSASTGEEQ